jgi:hypothetical protein
VAVLAGNETSYSKLPGPCWHLFADIETELFRKSACVVGNDLVGRCDGVQNVLCLVECDPTIQTGEGVQDGEVLRFFYVGSEIKAQSKKRPITINRAGGIIEKAI